MENFTNEELIRMINEKGLKIVRVHDIPMLLTAEEIEYCEKEGYLNEDKISH